MTFGIYSGYDLHWHQNTNHSFAVSYQTTEYTFPSMFPFLESVILKRLNKAKNSIVFISTSICLTDTGSSSVSVPIGATKKCTLTKLSPCCLNFDPSHLPGLPPTYSETPTTISSVMWLLFFSHVETPTRSASSAATLPFKS